MDSFIPWDDQAKQTLLDRCILDYLRRRNLGTTAEAFAMEAGISGESCGPEGFLSDWWGIACDVLFSNEQSDNPATFGGFVSLGNSLRDNQQMQTLPNQQQLDPQTLASDDFWNRLEPLPEFVIPELPLDTNYGSITSLPPAEFHDEMPSNALQCYDFDQWLREQSSTSHTSFFDIGQSFEQGAQQDAQAADLEIKRSHEISMDVNKDSSPKKSPVSSGNNGDDVGSSAKDASSNPQEPSSGQHIDDIKDFSFDKLDTFYPRNGGVLCCDFSSDGTRLVAGHETKASVWNLDPHGYVGSVAGHANTITDVHFKQLSTVFATASVDRTIQLWDAADVSKPSSKLEGHTDQVMSVCFNPERDYIVCSCDSNGEIRLWNINQLTCILTFKVNGASRVVRFQSKNLIAIAAGNTIEVFNFTMGMKGFLQGHDTDIRAMCWHPTGKYLASVSEDSARIWLNMKCEHELQSAGSKFHSCVFHPGPTLILVIGSHQTVELWNCADSSKMLTVVEAHTGIVCALAGSIPAGLVASASDDSHVKLWCCFPKHKPESPKKKP